MKNRSWCVIVGILLLLEITAFGANVNEMKVSGIYFSKTKQRAFINDTWYNVGEKVDDYLITSIKKDSVTLSKNGTSHNLSYSKEETHNTSSPSPSIKSKKTRQEIGKDIRSMTTVFNIAKWVFIIAYIWLTILGFSYKPWWGITFIIFSPLGLIFAAIFTKSIMLIMILGLGMVCIMPIYTLVFSVMHWKAARVPFLITIACIISFVAIPFVIYPETTKALIDLSKQQDRQATQVEIMKYMQE
jgi:hypothetical protein